jgi:hypothetical protein
VIDASRFIPAISGGKTVRHEATFDDVFYFRDSVWSVNLQSSWLFDWYSSYFQIENDGTTTLIGTDDATIRTFTQQDIEILLKINGYELIEVIDRPTYAFDTLVFVAQVRE